MSKIYFVMPAYNEAENIENTIIQWYPIVERLSSNDIITKLIIANDGSKDNTFAIMNRLKEKYSLLEPLDKPNSGHGATIFYLYQYAIKNGAEYIFQTDSDGQTNPDEFWQMWENRELYDFQIGYRKNRQDGSNRIFVTKILQLMVWLLFHVWVKDANTPFRLMKSDKLCRIMDIIPNDFFLCNVAISAIAVKWKYKIGWHTITFKPRQGGKNSINMKRIFNIGVEAWSDFISINKKIKNN